MENIKFVVLSLDQELRSKYPFQKFVESTHKALNTGDTVSKFKKKNLNILKDKYEVLISKQIDELILTEIKKIN